MTLPAEFDDERPRALPRETLAQEVERRVAERTEELEAFMYSISHDLRSPLRALDLFSQALLETYGGQLDEQGRHYLVRMRAGAQRMGAMLEELLRLSRISRTDLRVEDVDLSELARQVVNELRELDPERQVDVVIADGISTRGDPELLRIVLENLLANAWKFTSTRAQADGLIEMGTTPDAGGLTLFVRDNGVGFDMAYAGRLFTPFQRMHPADEFPGVGVGLASARRIVERHGGRIEALAGPGLGATFTVTLPG